MLNLGRILKPRMLLQLASTNSKVDIVKRCIFNRTMIGNRDVVGFGKNGSYTYLESTAFPFPAVRWMENSPTVMALREKEKGDWRKMTVDEKKTLYRASFCQTFSEMNAPTGEWKYIVGMALGFVGLGLWLSLYYYLVVAPPFPETLTDEGRREAMLRRYIDLRANPITGIASKWDYENDRWK